MRIDNRKLGIALAKSCLSMKELSEKSGVNVVTLARANTGTQDPRPITVGKIAKALNVNVEEIIEV